MDTIYGMTYPDLIMSKTVPFPIWYSNTNLALWPVTYLILVPSILIGWRFMTGVSFPLLDIFHLIDSTIASYWLSWNLMAILFSGV